MSKTSLTFAALPIILAVSTLSLGSNRLAAQDRHLVVETDYDAMVAAQVNIRADVKPAGTDTLTDANIAAIVVTANTADIKNGELALSRSSNEEVKGFAKTMVTDHTAVNKQAAELVARLGVKPEPNSVSTGLAESTDKTRDEISTKKGAAFDKAYIANEVTYHQSVLETIDKALIPSAQNAELKNLLIKVRPAFVAHLEHAKQVQSSLEG